MSVATMQIAALANANQGAGAGTWPQGLSNTAGAQPGAGAAPFGDLLASAVSEENQIEAQAQKAVSGLMTGTGVDVHQAMIATQKASMAFELSLAVRNKAVQAYQQVMSLQF